MRVSAAMGGDRPAAAATCLVIRPDYGTGLRAELPLMAAAVKELVQELEDHEVTVVHLPTDTPGGALDELERQTRGPGPFLVYVGGHGLIEGGDHYTLLDATPMRPSLTNAIWTPALVTLLAGAGRDIVLLVDTCFSGAAVTAIGPAMAVLAASPTVTGFGLVAACRAFATAEDGEFVEALLRLMRSGARLDATAWGPKDNGIRLGALAAELGHAGVPVSDVLAHGASELRVVPNLQEPDEPGRVHIKLRLRRLSGGAETHLMDKSEGFVGRVGLRERIGCWLATATQGMFVVTGGPGTGKSALMGLLARQSAGDPGVGGGEDGPSLAEGTFDVIVHARQKSADRVRAELAGVGAGPATVLVDAVDEAVAGESIAIAAHLRVLVRQPGIRMVVGTRPSPVVAARHTGRDPLLGELGPSELADLDHTAATTDDIAVLVRRLLTEPDSPYHGPRRGRAGRPGGGRLRPQLPVRPHRRPLAGRPEPGHHRGPGLAAAGGPHRGRHHAGLARRGGPGRPVPGLRPDQGAGPAAGGGLGRGAGPAPRHHLARAGRSAVADQGDLPGPGRHLAAERGRLVPDRGGRGRPDRLPPVPPGADRLLPGGDPTWSLTTRFRL